MAKKAKKAVPSSTKKTEIKPLPLNQALQAYRFMNTTQTREALLRSLLTPNRDINSECGYPTDITTSEYKEMYDREAVSKRVVTLMPEECWTQQPEVYEDENPKNVTEFEKRWKEIDRDFHICHFMEKADVLSGIGRFGLLLIGIGDGGALSSSVRGIDPKTGKMIGTKPLKHELLYLRVFDESVITIDQKETDIKSPRFGQPILYSVRMESEQIGTYSTYTDRKVHWTRVVHLADNCDSSLVYGIPRMQPVYNRLLDMRKILGGSAEMFWRGGFPGFAFEVNPDLGNVTLDTASLKEQFELYSNSLQRYLAVQGVTTKSLSPQVSDPKGHIEAQLQAIALELGIPLRIFVGTEEGKLASTQDKRLWAERVSKRRETYLTHMLIRPVVNRLIDYGVLPTPQDYFVEWPDRSAASDKDIADIARIRTEALKNYVSGGVNEMMSELDYLTCILRMSSEEAASIVENAVEQIDEIEKKEEAEARQKMDMEIEKATAISKVQSENRPAAPAAAGKAKPV